MNSLGRLLLAVGKASLIPLFLVAGVLFVFQVGHYMSAEGLPQYGDYLRSLYERHPVATISLFTLAVTLAIGVALPLMQFMPAVAGYCFGFGYGAVSALIFNAAGPVITMLLSRYLIGAAVQKKLQKKYGKHLETLNAGLARDGLWYMLLIRQAPLPFFAINLCMGLTSLSASRFAVINAIGLAPGTVMTVYFGALLAELKEPSDFFKPEFLAQVILLIVVPILSVRLVHRWLKNRKAKNQPGGKNAANRPPLQK